MNKKEFLHKQYNRNPLLKDVLIINLFDISEMQSWTSTRRYSINNCSTYYCILEQIVAEKLLEAQRFKKAKKSKYLNRYTIKGYILPRELDSFSDRGDGTFYAEYDGWHFEGETMMDVTNQILKYIFAGGEE